ncbi:Zinc finger BED domain-containing protein 1 [Eumeta japonica]|uniref:Zinc finger BED domain-containing protein 1 n=1 Tax=Eumeta variegata TaxID=151549 RepID=A0A4C1SMD5_EUMVA|nr:Zinc finger BED domain-containing protein 1 [Eumeta japonica]
MEPEGKHRNSIMKQRILAMFGFVEFVLRCTLTMNDFQGLMMQPEGRSEAESGPSTQKRVNKRARLTIPRKEYYSRNDLVEEQILTNSILQNPKSEAITMSLVKMIAVDMLPLSFVEGPGLLQFLHTVCPDYTVPSRTVIRDRLQGLYDAVRNKLLLTLNKFPHVAITTDGWSSRSNCSFVTITVHGVDEQWNLCSFTLDTLEMLENHTATNTYNYLVKALNNWNLYEKVIAVVHDNARYIVAAIRDNWKSDDDIEMSVRCSCHSLQCSVETALKECHLKDCLQKVSAIVGHFKHSNKATTALENAQKKINLPIHRLISHSPTRWNSAYEMVERLVEQRDAVEKQQDDDTENIILIKETLEEELKNRFLSNSDVTSCGLASYLDPRYKDLANEEETYRNKIKEKLMDMTERINVNEPDSSKNQRERDLDFLFDPVRSLSGNVQRMASLEGQTAIEKEMLKYDREPTIPKADNPLLWWNSKRNKYPILANFARKFLGIPSSSTPSERVFSTAGNLPNSSYGVPKLREQSFNMATLDRLIRYRDKDRFVSEVGIGIEIYVDKIGFQLHSYEPPYKVQHVCRA